LLKEFMKRYMGKIKLTQGVETKAKMREHVVMSVPNLLTLLRISLIPIFVLVFYLPVHWSYAMSATVFGIAAFTDWLDGYLARKLKQVSPLGEFLDPVADKLIVAVALVLLVQAHASVFLTIPAAIIVCREIVISALREWMAEVGKRRMVAVSWLGKLKTAGQMVAILLLLSQNPKNASWVTALGFALIYVASLLTLWSMVIYLRAAWDDLMLEQLP
jgi:CDP-diacylglycerol--glycerol-3-phosphate 3-phosphatidyltransferase